MRTEWFTIRRGVAILVAAAVLISGLALAAPRGVVRRAKPPTFASGETSRIFFPDAREKLVGERPTYQSTGAAASSIAEGDKPAEGGGPSGKTVWSKLIAAEALEDEVKSVQRELSKTAANLSQFKGGGNKHARRQLSELACLFAIIAEYDGDVRWQKPAAGLRELMARAGFNSKVGTEQAYKEVKARANDLEELVRGGTVQTPDADRKAKWDKVAGRPPLMQRLEAAHQKGVAVWTANANDFSRHADALSREAMLIAALAVVIQQEGFEYFDDATYLEYARNMQQHASAVVDAVKNKNYEAARKAAGEISKDCAACHDGYRSN